MLTWHARLAPIVPVIALLVGPSAGFGAYGAEPVAGAGVSDDQLAQARAAFIAAYESHGRPRLSVVVNERVGVEPIKLRDPLRTILSCNGAVIFADRKAVSDESRLILTRLNRLHPSVRHRADMPTLSKDIGLMIVIDAEPSRAGLAAVARAFDTRSGVMLGESASPVPPVWTSEIGERAARRMALDLFRAVAARWTELGPGREIRVRIDGITSAERLARASEALARLPGLRRLGEPTRSASLREAVWTMTVTGPMPRIAAELRTILSCNLDLTSELRSFGEDSIELRVLRRGEAHASGFAIGYERAKRPRIATIFSVFEEVGPPGRAEPPLIIGGGANAAVKVEADVRQLETAQNESELRKLLRLSNRPIEAMMSRALADGPVEFVEGESVCQLPWKSGRRAAALPDGGVMLPLALAGTIADVLILGETIIERGAGDTEFTGTAHVLARAVDVRTGELLARTEERWPYNPQFTADFGPNQGPYTALEGAAMRLADAVMLQLARHWLGGEGIALEFDPSINPEQQPALAACLFDRARPGMVSRPERDKLGEPAGYRVWFEGDTPQAAAAMRSAVEGVPAWSGLRFDVIDGRIAVHAKP